ncbi:BON domain-containing protein [Sorangium sp. So ce1128]
MQDRFSRDVDYGQGDRGWDRDENRAPGRDQDRNYGRTVQRGYGDYTLDEGRFVGGRERGHGDYDRGFSGHGREQDRGWGREQDRGWGREQDRGFGGYGRDQDRGYGQDLVRDVRDAGRSAMQRVSGALSEAGDRVRSAFGRGPKGYKRSDDRIREDICEMISDRDDIDAGEVTVRVQNCEVTLEGTVTERHHKRIIEQIAENVRGVEDVHNQIRVQRPGATATATSTTGTTGTIGAMGTTGAQQSSSRAMANDVAHR